MKHRMSVALRDHRHARAPATALILPGLRHLMQGLRCDAQPVFYECIGS